LIDEPALYAILRASIHSQGNLMLLQFFWFWAMLIWHTNIIKIEGETPTIQDGFNCSFEELQNPQQALHANTSSNYRKPEATV
jgi:hypothetical protein